MKKIDLNGVWAMRSSIDSEWLEASVPGSWLNTLHTEDDYED